LEENLIVLIGGKMDKEFKSHPNIANKVVLVDFDGTLYPWGYMFSNPDPLPGAVDALCRLKEAGYQIVIFTSRLSTRWLEHEDEVWYDHIDYIKALLKRDGIPYDEITAEKLPAEHYIDDKAHRFENNWNELIDRII
jgi:FMN phosphatase YigB (HAD superfamily)